MKRALFILLLCAVACFGAPIQMHQIAVIKKGAGGAPPPGGIELLSSIGQASTNGLGFTTASIDTTGASLIVSVISDYVGETASVLTDSEGNTWTVSTATTASNTRCRIAYCVPSSTSASHTFTLSGPAGMYPSLCVAAFSGTHATPLDQANGTGTTGATSAQPGSVTPSEDGELIITGTSHEVVGALSVNGGFTINDQEPSGGGTNIGVSMAYYVQPTAGAINPTWSWTGSNNAAARIATFKAE